MFRRIALVGVVSAAVIAVAIGGASAGQREVLRASNPHAYPAKGAKPGGSAGKVALLSWHQGPVKHGTTQVYPIYWGTTWSSSGATKISDINSFYGGVGGTGYANTNTEYYDGGGNVSSAVHGNASVTDGSSAPSNAPSTGAVLAEVAKMYPSPQAGAYYPVYVDSKRGSAGYCAWHSSGSIGGTTVQFAFFFNLDGDPGCDPGSSLDSRSDMTAGIVSLGNVSGHELSEMVTDPQLNAWYDRQGAENADKCAWTFSGNTQDFGGHRWIIQGNWSNNAYNSNSGYVRGCID